MLFVEYIKELWKLVFCSILKHVVKVLGCIIRSKLCVRQPKPGPGYKRFFTMFMLNSTDHLILSGS